MCKLAGANDSHHITTPIRRNRFVWGIYSCIGLRSKIVILRDSNPCSRMTPVVRFDAYGSRTRITTVRGWCPSR